MSISGERDRQRSSKSLSVATVEKEGERGGTEREGEYKTGKISQAPYNLAAAGINAI